jgi:hypothetical protein
MPMEERRGARDAVSVIGHERKRGESELADAGIDEDILTESESWIAAELRDAVLLCGNA